jgi:hypothetical protein
MQACWNKTEPREMVIMTSRRVATTQRHRDLDEAGLMARLLAASFMFTR